MKTHLFITPAITTLITTFLVVLNFGLASAQMAETNDDLISFYFVHNKNIDPIAFDFAPNYLDGKVYVNWTVTQKDYECTYVIQRSEDNENFETIGYKKGVATGIKNKIRYSFIDEKPFVSIIYYRLGEICKDGTIKYSQAKNIDKG